VFDASGGYLTRWGAWGKGEGQFDTPAGIALDPRGSVYVTDAVNSRVQRFVETTAATSTTWTRLKSLYR